MEDLKTNRDAQITVGCIAFFLIAFLLTSPSLPPVQPVPPLVVAWATTR